jgi:heme/copper-type cytochrome/quinol oxidase subunit 3
MAVAIANTIPAELPRPRTLLIGSSLAAAASVMVMAGLLGTYVQERSGVIRAGQTWLPKGAIELAPGTMMLFTMLMSAVTIQWAVYAISRDDRKNTYVALGLTGLFGAAVINQMAFAYSDMGLPIATSTANLLVYVVTGSFLVMLVVAMIFVVVTAFRALAGQYSSRQADGIVAAAIYWHSTVAVYAVVWYAVFVTK